MKITVVIPTHDRAALLAGTLASLADQDVPPTEVIVVANACHDDTADVVRRLGHDVRRLRRIDEPRLGVSLARNRGVAEASCELVAFIDDDAVASRTWIGALMVAAGKFPRAAAYAGPIDLRWPEAAPPWVAGLHGWYGRYDRGDEPDAIVYPEYPFGSNLAVWREPFLSVGGFPAELGPRGARRLSNEEDGLCRQFAERGWSVMYQPSARVHHLVHGGRISRRYLVQRAFWHGRSATIADSLDPANRGRGHWLRRSLAELGGAAGAAAHASRGPVMPALVESAARLGRATSAGALGIAGRRNVPSPPVAPGLTSDELRQFRREGFVRVESAFAGADRMEDRLWEFFARRGMRRDDPATWRAGEARHLQKLLRDDVFMHIGGARTSAAIDDVLGEGRWRRPPHWGELLVTFPTPHVEWAAPTLWHTDANYDDPLDPPAGVLAFSFLNGVGRRQGGTLVLAGSHRLIARFMAARPELAGAGAAVVRRHFYASHPWLEALVDDGRVSDREDRLAGEADIDGVRVRVVELTGAPGDVVLAHPLLAHCISPNVATQPRFMRVVRPRVWPPDPVTVGP